MRNPVVCQVGIALVALIFTGFCCGCCCNCCCRGPLFKWASNGAGALLKKRREKQRAVKLTSKSTAIDDPNLGLTSGTAPSPSGGSQIGESREIGSQMRDASQKAASPAAVRPRLLGWEVETGRSNTFAPVLGQHISV